jgi:hypothetical protein
VGNTDEDRIASRERIGLELADLEPVRERGGEASIRDVVDL